jgi:hypothetical protein
MLLFLREDTEIKTVIHAFIAATPIEKNQKIREFAHAGS